MDDQNKKERKFSGRSDSVISKKRMLAALKYRPGDIAAAAKAIGMWRRNHYYWLKDDPEYAEAYAELTEETIDHLEGELQFMINGQFTLRENKDGTPALDANGLQIRDYITPPDNTLLKFKLLTKAKDRGYVYRQEITGPDANPLFGGFEVNIKRKK